LPKRKLALVTGASGGLGLEFARLLAADGYDLALVARSGDRLAALAQSLQNEHGISAESVALDLSAPGAAAAVFARVPSCDVLINNAGFGSNGRFDRIPQEDVRSEISLDVLALAELTRAYLPGMIERHDGKIMNIASTAGFLPGPFMAVYYASKAFVISFSEALWEEMRGTGVTVTCYCPGATETGFAQRAGLEKTILFKLPVADAARVAAQGYRAMQRGKRLLTAWPPSNWFVGASARMTPRRLMLWMSRKAVEVKE
jgi:uncharacterized protein